MRFLLIVVLVSCVFAVPTHGANNAPPDWIQQARTHVAPAFPADTEAVVLFYEEQVVVEGPGKLTRTYRKMIKILNAEGRRQAVAAVPYFSRNGKVRDLRAWLIEPSGFVKYYGKDKTLDIGEVDEDLYDEVRMRTISSAPPEIGAVFAYEAEVEERSALTQDEFFFQSELPGLQSRYVVTVPEGWTIDAKTFNHSGIDPVLDGRTHTWTLSDLQPRHAEMHGPGVAASVPRLCVTFVSPAQSGASKAIRNWIDASSWLTDLMAGQDDANEAMGAKVKQLTAAAGDNLAKVKAIASYVQRIKYVSIQMNLANGGGYRPHPASTVFQKQYGDCKDKANLLRSLLRLAGISSYPVTLYSGDRTFVREQWPSPRQFNHAILAVHVDDEVKLPAIVENTPVGRLLIFDPTDEFTPLGFLPDDEQGSFALLVAGEKGTLLRLPLMPAESNLNDMSIQALLDSDGKLKGNLVERNLGAEANSLRAQIAARSSAGKGIELWLSSQRKGLQLAGWNFKDDLLANSLNLDLSFSSDAYAQVMQQHLLMLNPAVLLPRDSLFLRPERREGPLVLDARVFRRKVTIRLPPNFEVDEMPGDGRLDTPFAHFMTSYKLNEGSLVVSEELETKAATLMPEEYSSARRFFESVRARQSRPVVLVKKSL